MEITAWAVLALSAQGQGKYSPCSIPSALFKKTKKKDSPMVRLFCLIGKDLMDR